MELREKSLEIAMQTLNKIIGRFNGVPAEIPLRIPGGICSGIRGEIAHRINEGISGGLS